MSNLLDLARSSIPMAILIASTIGMFAIAIAFLVAASVLRRANNRKATKWAALETNWAVSVDYVARGLAGTDTLHYSIGRDQRLLFLDYLYKCAVKELRPERREVYASLAQPYLPHLETRIHQGDVWQRARAIRTLAELGGREHGNHIIRALDDPAPHVAMTAARTYARLKLGPIKPLLDRIERYHAWDRRLLRLTLTSFGPSAAAELHACFADMKASARTRAVCADALASLDYHDANDTAASALLNEKDIDLRAAALRLIRAPVSAEHRALIRTLCAEDDAIVRAQAVACLARVGETADFAALETALADLSPWVVLNATKGLNTRQRGTGEQEARVVTSRSGEWE